jgi:hypothetical protein
MDVKCLGLSIFYLDTNWRWMTSFTPRTLYPAEKVTSRALWMGCSAGPQNLHGLLWETKILFSFGTRTPAPTPWSVAIPTVLSRFPIIFHHDMRHLTAALGLYFGAHLLAAGNVQSCSLYHSLTSCYKRTSTSPFLPLPFHSFSIHYCSIHFSRNSGCK